MLYMISLAAWAQAEPVPPVDETTLWGYILQLVQLVQSGQWALAAGVVLMVAAYGAQRWLGTQMDLKEEAAMLIGVIVSAVGAIGAGLLMGEDPAPAIVAGISAVVAALIGWAIMQWSKVTS